MATAAAPLAVLESISTAASLLQQCKDQEAIQELHNGLVLLSKTMLVVGSSDKLAHPGFRAQTPKQATEPTTASPMDELCTSTFNGSFNLFNQAIVFPLDAQHGQDLQKSAGLCSAVLLYNLGLAFHRISLQQGDDQVLRQALQFYEGAFDLLMPSDELVGSNQVLASALVNNMCHIYAQHFATHLMQHHWLLLHHLVNTTTSSSVTDESVWQFFRQERFVWSNFGVSQYAPAA